jgi:hypothetical protein
MLHHNECKLFESKNAKPIYQFSADADADENQFVRTKYLLLEGVESMMVVLGFRKSFVVVVDVEVQNLGKCLP